MNIYNVIQFFIPITSDTDHHKSVDHLYFIKYLLMLVHQSVHSNIILDWFFGPSQNGRSQTIFSAASCLACFSSVCNTHFMKFDTCT